MAILPKDQTWISAAIYKRLDIKSINGTLHSCKFSPPVCHLPIQVRKMWESCRFRSRGSWQDWGSPDHSHGRWPLLELAVLVVGFIRAIYVLQITLIHAGGCSLCTPALPRKLLRWELFNFCYLRSEQTYLIWLKQDRVQGTQLADPSILGRLEKSSWEDNLRWWQSEEGVWLQANCKGCGWVHAYID